MNAQLQPGLFDAPRMRAAMSAQERFEDCYYGRAAVLEAIGAREQAARLEQETALKAEYRRGFENGVADAKYGKAAHE